VTVVRGRVAGVGSRAPAREGWAPPRAREDFFPLVSFNQGNFFEALLGI